MHSFINPTIEPARIRIQSENILFHNIGLDFGPSVLIRFTVGAALLDGQLKSNGMS